MLATGTYAVNQPIRPPALAYWARRFRCGFSTGPLYLLSTQSMISFNSASLILLAGLGGIGIWP